MDLIKRMLLTVILLKDGSVWKLSYDDYLNTKNVNEESCEQRILLFIWCLDHFYQAFSGYL